MKKLSNDHIRMVRDLEKSEGTFQPKKIWHRAWELMREKYCLGGI